MCIYNNQKGTYISWSLPAEINDHESLLIKAWYNYFEIEFLLR